AAAMKRDVDDILLKRFGVSGNISSYTLGTSGPMAAAGAAGAAGGSSMANTFANQPTRVRRSPITPVPPPPPQQPGAVYSPPPRQQGGNNVARNFLLFLLVILLLGVLAFVAVNNLRGKGTTTTSNNTPTPTVTVPSNGIGVTKAPDGEYIGISDGTFAFDTSRADGASKQQAAQELTQGNSSGAMATLNDGLSKDTNDAEALIYLEDQRVLASGNPHITIVVGTMLTGGSATASVGRDDLQGAYVAQKEFNDGAKLPNSVEVRLLIANAGSKQDYTNAVAQQIVQLAKVDKTFVGVMGWPFSGYANNAINVLRDAHIPMVSQTASSDALTGISPYFFRVAPPNKDQAIAGAKYAEQVLHARNVALFYDPSNLYTQSLANAFRTQFTADGNKIVVEEKYTVGKPDFIQLLNDAETHNPDLIYFAGYASDASVLLTDLPTSGQFANLQIMGGDALYELGGYTSSAHDARVRLHFTTFAYPDEWQIVCSASHSGTCSSPSFFGEYKAAYDPNNQHTTGSPYGYTRADGDVILSYDATLVMLTASGNALTGTKTVITPNDLQQALKQIKGAQAIQGISGQISLGPDGNPIKKALVILKVIQGGFFVQDAVQGCFQKGTC
ncbi:MAG TPA: ABC transporter substrate-binding protein, partial [Ktedonobacteraceae bacterium]|nr:ABC transporter substrate-binding protein [Ktedonobacteraceae bacterium]